MYPTSLPSGLCQFNCFLLDLTVNFHQCMFYDAVIVFYLLIKCGFITEKMSKRKMDMSLDDIIKQNKNEG